MYLWRLKLIIIINVRKAKAFDKCLEFAIWSRTFYRNFPKNSNFLIIFESIFYLYLAYQLTGLKFLIIRKFEKEEKFWSYFNQNWIDYIGKSHGQRKFIKVLDRNLSEFGNLEYFPIIWNKESNNHKKNRFQGNNFKDF